MPEERKLNPQLEAFGAIRRATRILTQGEKSISTNFIADEYVYSRLVGQATNQYCPILALGRMYFLKREDAGKPRENLEPCPVFIRKPELVTVGAEGNQILDAGF